MNVNSFDDIDKWVIQFINTKKMTLQTVQLSQSSNSFSKDDLNIFTGKWVIYNTSGNENDCMIHSLLTDCSDTFRKLILNDKNIVAREFRLTVFKNIVLSRIDPIGSSTEYTNAKNSIDSTGLLETFYLQYFCEECKFYIIIYGGSHRTFLGSILQTYIYEFFPNPKPNEDIINNYKTVVFNNTGSNHFSAMSKIHHNISNITQDSFFLDIGESEKVFKDVQARQTETETIKQCKFTAGQTIYDKDGKIFDTINSFEYQDDICNYIFTKVIKDGASKFIKYSISDFKLIDGKCIYDPNNLVPTPTLNPISSPPKPTNPLPPTLPSLPKPITPPTLPPTLPPKPITPPTSLDNIFDNPVQFNGKYPKCIDVIIEHQQNRFNELTGLLCYPKRKVYIPGYEKIKKGIPNFPFPYFINIGTGLAAQQFYPDGVTGIDNLVITIPGDSSNFKNIIYFKDPQKNQYVFNSGSNNIFTYNYTTLQNLKQILTVSPQVEDKIICFNYLVMMYKLNKLANELYSIFSSQVSFLDDDNNFKAFDDASKIMDDLNILVWGANIGNWNNDPTIKVEGEGQAKKIGKQRPGSFGIVTTPISFPSQKSDVQKGLLNDDKTKYTNNCSSVKSQIVTKNMNIMTYNINRESNIKTYSGKVMTGQKDITNERIIGLTELINKLYDRYNYFDFIGFQEIGGNKKILHSLNDLLQKKQMTHIESGNLSTYYDENKYTFKKKDNVTFGKRRSIYFYIFQQKNTNKYIVLLNFHLEHPAIPWNGNNNDGYVLNTKNIEEILSKLNNVIKNYYSNNQFHIIIVGDFNDQNKKLQEYINMVQKFIRSNNFKQIDYNFQHTIVGTCCDSNMNHTHTINKFTKHSEFLMYDNIFTNFEVDKNAEYRNYIYPYTDPTFSPTVTPKPVTIAFNLKNPTSDHIPVIATIPIKYIANRSLISTPRSHTPRSPTLRSHTPRSPTPRSPSSSPPRPVSSPSSSLPIQIVPIVKPLFTKTKEITTITSSSNYTKPEFIELQSNEKIQGIQEVKLPDTTYQEKLEFLKIKILLGIIGKIKITE